jgi:hypothetical protein
MEATVDRTAKAIKARTAQDVLDELQVKAGRPKPVEAPMLKPSMMDNYKTLGQGMLRGGKKMIDQRRIIVDEDKDKD